MRSEISIRRILFQIIVVAPLLFYGCGDKQPEYPQRHMPEGFTKDASQLNAGHDLFLNKCASCHGKPGEGRSDRTIFFTPAAPDFTDARYQEVDPAYLYWRIAQGKTVEPYRSQGSVMPAWGLHLSEKQIWQIVAYLQVRAH